MASVFSRLSALSLLVGLVACGAPDASNKDASQNSTIALLSQAHAQGIGIGYGTGLSGHDISIIKAQGKSFSTAADEITDSV